MEKYQAALDETPRVQIGAGCTIAGTVNAVVIGLFQFRRIPKPSLSITAALSRHH
jgi:hypothetical protein